MTTMNSEDLTKLAVGKRGVRRQRVNRALLAKMLRERAESDDAEEELEGDETTSEEDEGKLVRALIGSRVLRRRRVRNLVLAHLLRERASGEEEGEEEEFEDWDEEGGTEGTTDEDNRLVKAVIASRILRRRRARKAVLAAIIRARNSSEEEGDEEFGDEGTDEDNRLVKALIASRVLRRRRTRKLILAAIARQRGTEGAYDEDYEEEEDFGDEGSDDENRIVRALIGSRALRRRRTRRMLLTHLLRQREEVA